MEEQQEPRPLDPTPYYPIGPNNPAYNIRLPSDVTPETVHLIPPVNKFDTSRVNLLPLVSPEIWIPILPALLSWIADWCWPSSSAIYPLLRSNRTTIQACIPLVTDILDATEHRDEQHQQNLIHGFVNEIELEYQVQMLDCLTRFLANNSDELESQWEWKDGVKELIGDIKEGVNSPTRVGHRK